MKEIDTTDGSQKRQHAPESKSAEEHLSKREKSATVWAVVLEELHDVPRSYKLAIDLAKYNCPSDIADLEGAVKDVFPQLGYFKPKQAETYHKNPFPVEVEENNFRKTYQMATQIAGPLSKRKTMQEEGSEGTFYVLVSPLLSMQQMPMEIVPRESQEFKIPEELPTLDELLAQVDWQGFTFHGIVHDLTEQQRRFGQFSKSEAVIPFIRKGGDELYMDLHFAGFLDDYSHESKILIRQKHTALLETSATGKTKAIFDLGSQKYMIYIRCQVPDAEFSARPRPEREEFISTQDLVFPAVINLISDHCNTRRTRMSNDEAIQKATGFILADLVARLCFLLWSARNFPDLTPQKFLVAQLNGGQMIMQEFFRLLHVLPEASLKGLCGVILSELRLQYDVDPRWAMDEAQVVMEKFATYESVMHFEHSSDENGEPASIRGLLYQYTSLIVKEGLVGARQLVVAGTSLTSYATSAQVTSQIGKPTVARVIFPILTKEDVVRRLERVLNVGEDDADADADADAAVVWDNVANLVSLTGRCRWCASLVHFISRESERDALPKSQVLMNCIRKLTAMIEQDILNGVTARLTDARRDNKSKERDEILIKRIFVVCKLFTEHTTAAKMLFGTDDIDTILALGLGQLIPSGESVTHVTFDNVTAVALTSLATRNAWTAADIIAQVLVNDTKISKQERGLRFQLLIAAALCELDEPLTEFIRAIYKAEHKNKEMPEDFLPAWTRNTMLHPTGFTSFGLAKDVLDYLGEFQKHLGVIFEPDTNMRPDGVVIFGNVPQEETKVAEESKSHAPSSQRQDCYSLTYSAKLVASALAGNKRKNDLASTFLDEAYLPRPSKRDGGGDGDDEDDDEAEESKHDPVARMNWEQTVYPSLVKATQGRAIRLHVNMGGYANYKMRTKKQAPYDVGIKGSALQHVHVDDDKLGIRLIIDHTNFHVLFRNPFQQAVIRQITHRLSSTS